MPCAFASACPAKIDIFAGFACFRCVCAAFNEFFCRVAKSDLFKIRDLYIAQQIFVRAVKIAGINIAVAFANKLPCAKTVHSALLSRAAKVKAHPVVKLAHAYVSAFFIIFGIETENITKEIAVFSYRHKQIAFAVITERFQAGDELNVFKSLTLKKIVYLFSVSCRISRQDCKNIIFGSVLFQGIRRF